MAGALMPALAAADTLEQALAAAYERNPQLEANRALVRAVDEQKTQAKAAYGPQLTISASHEYTHSDTVLPSGTVRDRGFATGASLALSQPLFTSGRLAAQVDAASAAQMGARENLRASSQQLILEVVTAYVQLHRDVQLYTVATENYDILVRQRELVGERQRLRDATLTDVDQTENRLQIAAGSVLQARAALQSSAARYRNVVGKYPDTIAPLPPLPPVPDLESLYDAGEVSSPELGGARFDELSSRAQLAGARAERGPNVTASVIGERAPFTRFENSRHVNQLVVGVGASMPLYTGGQISSRIREGIERNVADQHLVEQARRTMRETIAVNWNFLQAAEESLPRYRIGVEAATRAVEGVRQQEQLGIATLREVLDVTADLLTARTNAAQAEAELYLRKVALFRTAGTLSVEMFGNIAAYDPDGYKPGVASLAGLPLGPVLEPIDSLFLMDHGRTAPIQKEADPRYVLPSELRDPLAPVRTSAPSLPPAPR